MKQLHRDYLNLTVCVSAFQLNCKTVLVAIVYQGLIALLLTGMDWQPISAQGFQRDDLANLAADDLIDLQGSWSVQLLDDQSPALPSQVYQVKLPGALRDSGVGRKVSPQIDDWIGSIKPSLFHDFSRFLKPEMESDFLMPYWLVPEYRFVGRALYTRRVNIPDSWLGEDVELILERPHWKTRVFVNGALVGQTASPGTPHRYELTKFVRETTELRLSVEVNNGLGQLDLGRDAHSISDQTQSAWNGIVGAIQLRRLPPVRVDNFKIYPKSDDNKVAVSVVKNNSLNQTTWRDIEFEIWQGRQRFGKRRQRIEIPPGKTIQRFDIDLTGTPKTWDEFQPTLSRLNVTLHHKGKLDWKGTESFGFRDIEVRNNEIFLNGTKLFLRGTLECCIFPRTGHPPTDSSSWRKIIRICKSHGLNHMRFHSWCPPKAAFVAADELGFYFQVECSTWPTGNVTLGSEQGIDSWLRGEATRVIEEYGNHPSFLLLAAGNEAKITPDSQRYLDAWVRLIRKTDESRFLVSGGAGWPAVPANQFFVSSRPRLHRWNEGLRDRLNRSRPNTVENFDVDLKDSPIPLIAHEIGQWCSFPDIKSLAKFNGALQPDGLTIIKKLLEAEGLLDLADDFVTSSGKLQLQMYKEEIESQLRTPQGNGFQLLDLRDFPGQGLAPVGLLDMFWDRKPYVAIDSIRKFCGPITPLAVLPKRVWQASENFTCSVQVAHYGPRSFPDSEVQWALMSQDEIIESGRLRSVIKKGGLRELGNIKFSLPIVAQPRQYTLQVSIPEANAVNDWSIWVLPHEQPVIDDPELTVVAELDNDAIDRLKEGGRVLLTIDPKQTNSEFTFGFSPIFWNSLWCDNEPPHTLGILSKPTHPVFENFITQQHTDWHWWDILSKTQPMDLSELKVEPIVHAIPDWYRPKKLGLMFECRCLAGRLFVTSIDLKTDLANRPMARQLRTSLLRYLASDDFQPKSEASWEEIRQLSFPRNAIKNYLVNAESSSEHEKYEVENAVDGDPKTIWHASWKKKPMDKQHWIDIDLGAAIELDGIRLLPRQDRRRTRIRKFRLLVGEEDQSLRAVAEGRFDKFGAWKTIRFERTMAVRYIRLEMLSSNDHSLASLAEFDIIPHQPLQRGAAPSNSNKN